MRGTVKGEAAIWFRTHVPVPLRWAMVAAVAAETLLGSLPAILPWNMGHPAHWGLLLPLITIAVCVTMLHSGFGPLEFPHRRHWRTARFGWCLLAALVATVPGLWCVDGLDLSGSVRNRLAFFSLACLSSLIVPATLSAVLPTLVMLVSMMMAAASPSPETAVFLLREHASIAELTGVTAVVLLVAAAYGLSYPPRWARRT
ncbi:MAG: hypothetical protein Q4P15_10650 [Propionibacteriaceae bacterium]|nr:hypothetical protein [Propionibacteriaceae bacterium]